MARSTTAALLLLLALSPPTAAGRHRDGEPLTISGRVTDAAGTALPGVTVLLRASHRRFRLRRMAWEPTGTVTVPTTTDDDGAYTLHWQWDDYYDAFELAVALPVRQAGEDAFEVFARLDVTARLRGAAPVVVGLVVEDTAPLEWLRRFLDGLASEDERRVYHEMGKPDRIDRLPRGEEVEVSWWYFAAGKAYRFRGGELAQVVHFDPVEPFAPPPPP